MLYAKYIVEVHFSFFFNFVLKQLKLSLKDKTNIFTLEKAIDFSLMLTRTISSNMSGVTFCGILDISSGVGSVDSSLATVDCKKYISLSVFHSFC